MSAARPLFATAPKGIPSLLIEELAALGAADVRESVAGAAFSGDLALAYRVCLWSRLASRVLLPLAADLPATDGDTLYAGVRALPWEDHLAAEGTLAVDFTARRSRLSHSRFGAQKVKDAIVDRLRDLTGTRPSVDRMAPDLRINVHLDRDRATVSLDLSGDSLHRRGYRREPVAAPLKENLAAAILVRAGWPAVAEEGGSLVDPMCGSGTLLVEAALMAGDIAPGLLRSRFGFQGWKGHDAALWEALMTEAQVRRSAGEARIPGLWGRDADPAAVRAARVNADAAGLAGRIDFERGALADLVPPPGAPPGLVVVNPPYGQRLGEARELADLYRVLGERLRAGFSGWHAAVFTGNPELGKSMGLRARRQHALYNGAIACKLLHFDVDPRWFVQDAGTRPAPLAEPGPGARMFANRVTKNLRHLGRWARREGICCWRVYDADIPEYALAVDLYEGDRRWVHVQEYEAPGTVDPRRARLHLREVMTVLPQVLAVDPGQVHFKVRRRQRGREQYGKLAEEGRFHEVREGAARLLVNFTDYLDTGLFLDHRLTRALIGDLAEGRRFLNLFAYTGAATVHAAQGGAAATTSVDLSRTYLDWARRNLELNGLAGEQHALVQADCLQWLADAARRREPRYGLVFLDPPTFSTSKRMTGTLDVQRDHVKLIRLAAGLLEPDGVLIFSNNLRRFRMDREALAELVIADITRATLPKDFERNPRIHNCWRITRA